MEPRLRASPEQFSVIIGFMERHGDLLKPPPGPQGRIKVDKLWIELTNILNSLPGGIKKSTDKWKKVWADWKTKTKKKYLRITHHASVTDDGPNIRRYLNATEERVVAVIGISAVAPAGYSLQGLNQTSSAVMTKQEVETDDHSENVVAWSPAQPATPELSPSPPEPTPPVTQHTPPVPQNTPPTQQNHTQDSNTPLPKAPNVRRVRARRGRTPFERAADHFAAVEQRRLQNEEARDQRLHEREMERLQLDAERIRVAREQNALLRQLSLVGQRLVDVIMDIQKPA